jgi:hypothetical protein
LQFQIIIIGPNDNSGSLALTMKGTLGEGRKWEGEGGEGGDGRRGILALLKSVLAPVGTNLRGSYSWALSYDTDGSWLSLLFMKIIIISYLSMQGRIKTLGGPMPKDRGGPDQGIFQDFWTGVSEGLGVTTFFFFFLLATPERG